jgi:hypothetical protein
LPTVFFAADGDEFAELAAGIDLAGMAGGLAGLDTLDGLDTVPAGDLDPAQLIDLDVLVTGSDPVEAREAVLTPAHEGPDGTGGTVLLPVRPALRMRLAHLTEQEVDVLAEEWSLAAGAADGGWSAYRCGQLIRSLSLLALLGQAERRDLYVRFDS